MLESRSENLRIRKSVVVGNGIFPSRKAKNENFSFRGRHFRPELSSEGHGLGLFEMAGENVQDDDAVVTGRMGGTSAKQRVERSVI